MTKIENNEDDFDDRLKAQYKWMVVFRNHVVNDEVYADEASIDEKGVKFYLKGGVLVYFAPFDLVGNVYLTKKNDRRLDLVE